MTDELQQFMTKYAELRRIYIEKTPDSYEPLTYEQRMIALSDSVPCKPERSMWSAEEYEQKLAEYNRLIGYKLSPLGNYGRTNQSRSYLHEHGRAQHDPDFAAYLERRQAEREARGEGNFLERWQEERKGNNKCN